MRRLLLLLTLGLSSSLSAGGTDGGDGEWLTATSQRLLDAITNGDRQVWALVLADDWMLTDEEGKTFSRAEFLQDLHPLPPGQSGKLKLGRWQVRLAPGVAVITFDADEEHHYYGQLLRTRFHNTDTYVWRDGRWQQLASQVTALPTPVAGIELPRATLEGYVGEYELTKGIRLTISLQGGALVLVRSGQPPQALHALDDRMFIHHGLRGVLVFDREAAGRARKLTHWRDNNPVVWTRVK